MGFLSNVLTAGVKTILTPLAVVKDGLTVLNGEPADTTKELLDSIGDNLKDAVDDLGDGELF